VVSRDPASMNVPLRRCADYLAEVAYGKRVSQEMAAKYPSLKEHAESLRHLGFYRFENFDYHSRITPAQKDLFPDLRDYVEGSAGEYPYYLTGTYQPVGFESGRGIYDPKHDQLEVVLRTKHYTKEAEYRRIQTFLETAGLGKDEDIDIDIYVSAMPEAEPIDAAIPCISSETKTGCTWCESGAFPKLPLASLR